MTISLQPELPSLVETYSQLSCIEQPSDEALKKIEAILYLAQYGEELSALINQADHEIAKKLGLA
ncbi:MAG TPA: hypothetical protein V6C91_03870 [Coleofasciculaceae cyanobacterium]